MGDTSGPERFVGASRTLLDTLMLKNAALVPDEMKRLQELVECVENNAQKIAAALAAANRRRGASVSGANTTAQLLEEQKQYINQIEELFEQLYNKPDSELAGSGAG